MYAAAAPATEQAVATADAGWRKPLALFLALFILFAITASRSAISIDAHAAAVEAWHLGSTGSPWLEGDLNEHLLKDPWLSQAPNGHVVAQRMAGPVLVGIPIYWAATLTGDPSRFDLLPGGIAAAALTALSCLLMFLTLRRLLPEVYSTGATLAFALATPTWSVSANGLWTHTVTQFGLAGACLAVSRNRWLLAGVFLGVGITGRPHLALVAAVVGLGLAWSRKSLKPVVGIAIPTMVSILVLLVWNHWMFGNWSIGGAYGVRIEGVAAGFHGNTESGGPQSQLQNYLGFLIAPDRGLLVWSPLVVLLTPFVVRRWQTLPDWSRWFAVAGLIYTFVQLRINHFAGGDAFYGYRHGLELLTCCVPAFAIAFAASGSRARAIAVLVTGLQLGAIAWGAVTEGFFLPVTEAWTDNSLWLAFRHYPLLVACWMAAAVITALLSARAMGRNSVGRPAGD